MRFLGVYSTPTLPIATHTPLKPFETAYPLANSEKYTWAFLGANLLLAKPNSFGPFPLISMSVSEKQLLGSGFGSWGCENTLLGTKCRCRTIFTLKTMRGKMVRQIF